MTLYNIEKFSFGQLTSNADGKTSATGTVGIIMCVFGTLGFLLGCIDHAFITKTSDIMLQSVIFTGLGAGLLGYRKSTTTNNTDQTQSTQTDIKDASLNS